MLNFIVNVKSGKGQGLKNLKKIIDFCYDHKVEYTVHITSAQGHAERIAKTLCEQDSHNIVAVGGDGTFHEVINGVKGYEEVNVGFIPSGRGNDFARKAKLHMDPVKALRDIVRGETFRMDIISVGQRRCLNIAGTGLDVEVLRAVEGKGNKITYLLALIKMLSNFRTVRLDYESNDKSLKGKEYVMIGVCNGAYFGGGLNISPQSDLSDGKLNVCAIALPQNGKLMSALTKFKKGNHIGKEYVTYFSCEQISITSPDNFSVELDGEIYDNLPFDCRIEKGGLKTFKTSLV